MNKATAITAILAIVAASALFKYQPSPVTEVPREVVIAFNNWKLGQKRLYASPEEENHRLNVFYSNYKKVENVNKQNLSYKFKLNDFADMSHEEFQAKYLMKAQEYKKPEGVIELTQEMLGEPQVSQAQDFNWCNPSNNICSAVRTQGRCSAGYAFAAAKTLAYSLNKAGRGPGTNLWLSPQEYIDCSGNFGNNGCQGGYVTGAIQYSGYYGLNPENNYPYADRQQACQGYNNLYKPSNIYVVPSGNNGLLQQALNAAPLAVALDASQLQFYTSGIYDGPCSTSRITHFMNLIGYGSYQGTPYWRLENSWGTNWGQVGYMFMRKYDGFTSSPCGLPNQAVQAVA